MLIYELYLSFGLGFLYMLCICGELGHCYDGDVRVSIGTRGVTRPVVSAGILYVLGRQELDWG